MPDCKETQCTHCIHRIVCKLTEDYLRINEAINRLSVAKSEQGDRDKPIIRSTPIVNFDFAEVTVSCKYYEYNAEREGKNKTRCCGEEMTYKDGYGYVCEI